MNIIEIIIFCISVGSCLLGLIGWMDMLIISRENYTLKGKFKLIIGLIVITAVGFSLHSNLPIELEWINKYFFLAICLFLWVIIPVILHKDKSEEIK